MSIAQKLRALHDIGEDACDPEYNRALLEAADEIDRLRAALEIVAGSATDKLQALQARSALDNIGQKS